jgi:hypothetical protein
MWRYPPGPLPGTTTSYYKYPNIPYPNPDTASYDMYGPNSVPYDPILGKFGTCDVTLKGYASQDNCQYGFYPTNVGNQGMCCNVYGQCGVGDKRYT